MQLQEAGGPGWWQRYQPGASPAAEWLKTGRASGAREHRWGLGWGWGAGQGGALWAEVTLQQGRGAGQGGPLCEPRSPCSRDGA